MCSRPHEVFLSPLLLVRLELDNLLPPATKLRQGYVFTGVCDSVHGGGGRAWQGEACMAGGVCMVGGAACMAGGMHGSGEVCVAGEMTIAAGGTHPTGMHSFLILRSNQRTYIRALIYVLWSNLGGKIRVLW